MQEWLRKVDKIESSQKRKAKEAKNREFFEKVFPELRKQREDKERFNRVGARIKSEADLEEIMDGLQEQEMEDKKMRSYAVIPPILLDARQRKLKYANNNGHILDMETEHKERQNLNVWTNTENEIFKEKYLQHPKNFGVIASYLERKSVQDCVQHYYLSKKTENYKRLLRKSRQRTRSSRNNPQKVNNTANNIIVGVLTSTGVTTRLQREQQQKTVQVIQQQQQQQQDISVATATTTITTTTTITATNLSSTPTTTTATVSSNNSSGNAVSSPVTTNVTTSSVTSSNNNNNNSSGNNNSNNNNNNKSNQSEEKAKVVTINSNIIVSASVTNVSSSPTAVTTVSSECALQPNTNCESAEAVNHENTSNRFVFVFSIVFW